MARIQKRERRYRIDVLARKMQRPRPWRNLTCGAMVIWRPDLRRNGDDLLEVVDDISIVFSARYAVRDWSPRR
jgi:hypothetical protein